MRVAWVTPYFPAPANTGGRIRIGELARAFASDELWLFSQLSHHDTAFASAPSPIAPWHRVITFPHRGVRDRPWALAPVPARAMHPKMTRALSRAHGERPFDAVVVEHSYAATILPRHLPGAALVIDEHNVESAFERPRERRYNAAALRARARYAAYRAFEARLWRRADEVIVVSQADAADVRARRGREAAVVPNGIALDAYRFIAPSERRGSAVLFLGMMSYEPNTRAAIRLARDVLPRLKRRVPDATLTLAGRDPPPEVTALASPDVRVTGTLAAVAPLFDEHAAYAMPIDSGAGTSLKALEPLATGLPLVAPAFAVRGFGLEPDQHYLCAETDEAIADALARALLDRVAFDAMARRGRAVAEAHAWSEVGRRFAETVRAAAARRRP